MATGRDFSKTRNSHKFRKNFSNSNGGNMPQHTYREAPIRVYENKQKEGMWNIRLDLGSLGVWHSYEMTREVAEMVSRQVFNIMATNSGDVTLDTP